MSANSAVCYNCKIKTCTKCNISKDLSEFFIRNRALGKLHNQCKDCYRLNRAITYQLHYIKYKKQYLLRAKNRRKALRTEFRQNMLTYLVDKSCVDCGESDIRVLEFDHIDPSQKLFSISQSVRLGRGWSEVLTELEKCVIRCANCHKKRTSEQYNWYKSNGGTERI